MSLFTPEQLEAMYSHEQARQRVELVRKHAAMQPKPLTRTEKCESDRRVLVELAQEFAPVTVAELVAASGRSASWVRRHLRANGITPAKPVRRKEGQA
jgi:predicted O-methyltransferase YrrM